MKQKRNYNSIDLCKFVMAIFVIAMHTNPLIECSNNEVIIIYGLIVRMAVPFFFLSSGYLLAIKFDSFCNTTHNMNVVLKYLRKIVRMYIIWSIIYLPLAIYDYYANRQSIIYSVVSYVRGFIFVGEHYNSWHLWYLLSTIYAMIFVILIIRFNLITKKKVCLLVCGCICLLSVFMDWLVNYYGSLPLFLNVFRSLISYTTISGRILQGVFFIPIGIFMAEKNASLNTYLILFIGSICSNYFIENGMISSILLYITSIALFGMVLHVNLKESLLYLTLRRLSTDLYFIHMYVWTCYYVLIYREKRFGLDSFIITTVVSIVVSCVYSCFKRNRLKDTAENRGGK